MEQRGDYITLPIKHIDTGYTIQHIININTRMNDLKDLLANNIFNVFELNDNEYDIIENNNSVDNFENKTLTQTYKNSIKYVCFYIKPHQNSVIEGVRVPTSEIFECPICYEHTIPSNITTLQCSHSTCISCHNGWNSSCTSLQRNPSCPLCRTEY